MSGFIQSHGDTIRYGVAAAALVAGACLTFIVPVCRGKSPGNKNRLLRTSGVVLMVLALAVFNYRPGVSVSWVPYSQASVAEARERGMPVLIDFYADWCLPCHHMERTTYRSPAVVKALENFMTLKVDATDPESGPAAELIAKYSIEGLPAIVFLGPSGNEVKAARIFGYVSAPELLQVLNAPALESAPAG